jgi:excisionase family DNA binding protein
MNAADLIRAIGTLDRDQLPALMLAIAARLAESADPEPASNGKPALVDADELAQAVSLPKSHVMTLARQGRIPSVKVGKYVRFNVAEVEAALRNVDKC